MCTVTFIPQGKGNFILSSNRDEAAARSPKNISSIEQDGIRLVFPRDSKAGGTWIAMSETGRVVCLLNGAFVKHQHQPPYKKSRGIMVLDVFRYDSLNQFLENYDFEGMEPFTMVLVDDNELYELRWDEKEKHIKALHFDRQYIWSSATLYTPQIQQMRAEWFNEWLHDRIDFGLEAIQDFHFNGGKKDTWNGFIMNRLNLVQTVSHTNIIRSDMELKLLYNDLINNATRLEALALIEKVIH